MNNTPGPQLTINTRLHPFNYLRTEDRQEVSRFVRLARVTPPGAAAISRSEDGNRCVVTGKECRTFLLFIFEPDADSYVAAALRILRISSSSNSQRNDHKSVVGEGGYRIDSSRNLWDGSGLKIDCASTDVAWGFGGELNKVVPTVLIGTLVFNNKILTSARNGEVIVWDLGKAGPSKYGASLLEPLRGGLDK